MRQAACSRPLQLQTRSASRKYASPGADLINDVGLRPKGLTRSRTRALLILSVPRMHFEGRRDGFRRNQACRHRLSPLQRAPAPPSWPGRNSRVPAVQQDIRNIYQGSKASSADLGRRRRGLVVCSGSSPTRADPLGSNCVRSIAGCLVHGARPLRAPLRAIHRCQSAR